MRRSLRWAARSAADQSDPHAPSSPSAAAATATAARSSTRPAPDTGRWGWVRRHAPFALVFALAVALLSINVTTPWHSLHEDNGLLFMSAAINHIRFGLGYTKGQDYFDLAAIHFVYGAGGIEPQGVSAANEIQYFRSGPAQPVLYGHHPPLLGLTIAVSLLTFGYSFWAVRLAPILFTLAALLLFYRLMALLFAARPDATRLATFASALFISFPIAAYYGRDVAHEAPTLCWALGLALCYTQWRRSGRAGWLWGMAGCAALGMGYGWPMLFFAWLTPALDALGERRLDGRLALATAGVGTLVCGLVVTQIAWADGWSLGTLQQAFTLRSTSFGAALPQFAHTPWIPWAIVLLYYNIIDFSPLALLALLPALLFLWAQIRREGLSLRVRALLLFGLGGLAHILVFREGAYLHDYWQFYLIPFYAMLLAWSGDALAHRLTRRLTRWLARPAIAHGALLVTGAALALAMGAPILYHLHTGGLLLGLTIR